MTITTYICFLLAVYQCLWLASAVSSNWVLSDALGAYRAGGATPRLIQGHQDGHEQFQTQSLDEEAPHQGSQHPASTYRTLVQPSVSLPLEPNKAFLGGDELVARQASASEQTVPSPQEPLFDMPSILAAAAPVLTVALEGAPVGASALAATQAPSAAERSQTELQEAQAAKTVADARLATASARAQEEQRLSQALRFAQQQAQQVQQAQLTGLSTGAMLFERWADAKGKLEARVERAEHALQLAFVANRASKAHVAEAEGREREAEAREAARTQELRQARGAVQIAMDQLQKSRAEIQEATKGEERERSGRVVAEESLARVGVAEAQRKQAALELDVRSAEQRVVDAEKAMQDTETLSVHK